MILEEETFNRFGYFSGDLSFKSSKKIVAECDKCGKMREIRKDSYRELCVSCSQKGKKLSEEHKRKTGKTLKGKYCGENSWMYGKHLSVETKKKLSECRSGKNHHMYGKHHSEETKRKLSEKAKLRLKNPENHPMLGKHHTEEAKRKMSEAHLGKGMGVDHPNWKGGVSFEPYCEKFDDEFKEKIRNEFNRTCFLCNRTEEEIMEEMKSRNKSEHRLSIHHVNYNKNCLCSDSKCEFVPLCISCHTKTNFNRGYWEKLITDKLKNRN